MAINALMIGTGEYTTGYVHGAAADSDKSAGVVALTLFDLRRRGKVDRLAMAGTNGTRFPGIREHLDRAISRNYQGMDVSFESFPADDVARDRDAYKTAIDSLAPGDAVIVFTPDDTHFDIAMYAISRGCHTLIAKPIVKAVKQHLQLVAAARRASVLVAMEVHKRWDPLYADARDRIASLGEFSFFQSYMSQPKSQLETFKDWAGKSSDISYYLNAHHIDFNLWSVGRFARPRTVYASASTGFAHGQGISTEDTITLTVGWENLPSGNRATATYTASWIAPKSDVHSQQRFFYMGQEGEVNIDQAHRGYSLSTDATGYASLNPLFMKYTPDADGRFAGQSGYGYRGIEDFIDAVRSINENVATADSFAGKLATAEETVAVTAILEAGRRSLDDGGRVYAIDYDDGKVAGISPR
jgi:D-galacturonate reductase